MTSGEAIAAVSETTRAGVPLWGEGGGLSLALYAPSSWMHCCRPSSTGNAEPPRWGGEHRAR
jgi:hypothetical protein